MDSTEGAQRAPSPARSPSPSRSRRSPPAQPGSEGFWRPWLRTPGEKSERAEPHATQALPSGPGMTEASGKLSQYQHPVRLFWPKSKCYDYLYQEAETLLKKFPNSSYNFIL